MQQFTSTQAKQNFGQLLAAGALAPVAIERHGRVQAVLAAPHLWPDAQATAQTDVLQQRQLARLNQTVLEKDRLIRHQRIALVLALASEPVRQRMLADAQAVVARWQHEQLCSADYIERWSTILNMPMADMVEAMTGQNDPWGPALRQNSPWVGVAA